MIKAGPERDKKIAELQGDKQGECDDRSYEEYFNGWICETCRQTGSWNNLGEHDIPIKPYSTSIVHAMELWEEMKGAGSLELETFDKSLIHSVRCTLELPEEVYFYHEAETEADAISGAYLLWKETP